MVDGPFFPFAPLCLMRFALLHLAPFSPFLEGLYRCRSFPCRGQLRRVVVISLPFPPLSLFLVLSSFTIVHLDFRIDSFSSHGNFAILFFLMPSLLTLSSLSWSVSTLLHFLRELPTLTFDTTASPATFPPLLVRSHFLGFCSLFAHSRGFVSLELVSSSLDAKIHSPVMFVTSCRSMY